MATMTEAGTEKRVDELSKRVDHGFEQVDRRFEQVDRRFDQVDGRFDRVEGDIREIRSEIKDLRGEMNIGFARVDGRFESLQRIMLVFFATTLSSIIAAVIVIALSHS